MSPQRGEDTRIPEFVEIKELPLAPIDQEFLDTLAWLEDQIRKLCSWKGEK